MSAGAWIYSSAGMGFTPHVITMSAGEVRRKHHSHQEKINSSTDLTVDICIQTACAIYDDFSSKMSSKLFYATARNNDPNRGNYGPYCNFIAQAGALIFAKKMVHPFFFFSGHCFEDHDIFAAGSQIGVHYFRQRGGLRSHPPAACFFLRHRHI